MVGHRQITFYKSSVRPSGIISKFDLVFWEDIKGNAYGHQK